MSKLSSNIKDEIRQRIDLVEVVSRHVALKKAGRQFKGLCPFHPEKTPSFHVDPDRGLWFCFGCHSGGDVFDFVMRTGSLNFREAIEVLAARAGVQVEQTPQERREASEREQLLRVLDGAAAFFRQQLSTASGNAARDYLRGRGVDNETIEAFGLGYAPQAWEGLLTVLRSKGYPVASMERVGLVQARPSGDGHYDLFRHRLIFPIHDLQDRVVGFGGRALDDSTPKYLNSRESPAFNKGRLLFALHRAREAIREEGLVVLVEGFMDALTCHQFGMHNAVASLGTALTADHVLLLKRFATRAVVVYDSDAAGMLASERSLNLFEEHEMPVGVAVLPEGRDPDSYLRAEGAQKFRTIVRQALSMFEYRLAQAAARHDTGTVEGRVALADELLSAIASVANPIRQSEYLRILAERFRLSEDALRQRLAPRARSQHTGPRAEGLVPVPATVQQKAERDLLRFMVHAPETREVVGSSLSVEEFLDPLHRKLAEVLLGDDAPAEAIRDRLDDEERARLLTELLFEPPTWEENRKDSVLLGTIERIHAEQVKEELKGLERQIVEAEMARNDELAGQLKTQYQRLRSGQGQARVSGHHQDGLPEERG